MTMNVNLTEKEFMAQVIQLANLLGWMLYHTRDSRGSVPGFPDLVLVRKGELIFVELKTETGKVTHAQERWLQALHDADAIAYVWRPSDWPRIEQVLNGHPF